MDGGGAVPENEDNEIQEDLSDISQGFGSSVVSSV